MTVVGWLRQLYALGIRLSIKDGKLDFSHPIPEHFAYLRLALLPLEPAIIAALESDKHSVCSEKTLFQSGFHPDEFLQCIAVPHWAIEWFGGGALREGHLAVSACIAISLSEAYSVNKVREAITSVVKGMPWLAFQWWRERGAAPWSFWGAGLPKQPYIDFEY